MTPVLKMCFTYLRRKVPALELVLSRIPMWLPTDRALWLEPLPLIPILVILSPHAFVALEER